MKNLLLSFLLLALSVPAAIAQQTSCGTTFPTWMLCDNTTQTLYVPNLALTGGVQYSSGLYLVSIDTSGNLTFTKYTPTPGPQGIQGPPGPPGPVFNPGAAGSYTETYAATKLNSAQRICQSYTIQSAITVNNVLPVISPKVYPGDVFDWTSYVSGVDSISICVRNVSAATATMPKTAFLLRLY